MKCLVVLAHPVEDSLCSHLCTKTIEHLKNKGYDLTLKDLYKENFNPILSKEERKNYYKEHEGLVDIQEDIKADVEELKQVDSLVLIFPTWWFSFPSILKGWFDRVWAPGHVYNHASDLGPIKPLLTNLKEVKVITTMGSPCWIDYLILRQPVKRVLKYAMVGACTKDCDFKMLSLYKSESFTKQKVDKFIGKIKKTF